MKHPVQAQRIGELGADYLIDWVRTWLLRRPTDPGYTPGFQERVARAERPGWLVRTVWEELGAIGRLTANLDLREEVGELQGALSTGSNGIPIEVLAPVTERLSAAVLRAEGNKPYRFGEALDSQVSGDSLGILRTLAMIRHSLAAGEPVPLAAPLLPRDDVPCGGAATTGAVLEVIEVGDLGDPFCRTGHQRVHAELDRSGVAIRWRWLNFSSVQHLEESERLGALLDAVAALAPNRFWDAVDRTCETTPYGAERVVPSVLAEAGVNGTALGSWLGDDSHHEGLRRDRRMALACGAPYLRPLFVVGRRMFIGLDAAPAIRQLAESHGTTEPIRRRRDDHE